MFYCVHNEEQLGALCKHIVIIGQSELVLKALFRKPQTQCTIEIRYYECQKHVSAFLTVSPENITCFALEKAFFCSNKILCGPQVVSPIRIKKMT